MPHITVKGVLAYQSNRTMSFIAIEIHCLFGKRGYPSIILNGIYDMSGDCLIAKVMAHQRHCVYNHLYSALHQVGMHYALGVLCQ